MAASPLARPPGRHRRPGPRMVRALGLLRGPDRGADARFRRDRPLPFRRLAARRVGVHRSQLEGVGRAAVRRRHRRADLLLHRRALAVDLRDRAGRPVRDVGRPLVQPGRRHPRHHHGHHHLHRVPVHHARDHARADRRRPLADQARGARDQEVPGRAGPCGHSRLGPVRDHVGRRRHQRRRDRGDHHPDDQAARLFPRPSPAAWRPPRRAPGRSCRRSWARPPSSCRT